MIDLMNKTETVYKTKLDKIFAEKNTNRHTSLRADNVEPFQKTRIDDVTRLQKEHEPQIKVFKTKLIDLES